MRYATGITALLACCCLAGCAARPAEPLPGADVEFGDGWNWYDADPPVGLNAAWGVREKKLVYVILADVAATAATTTTTADGRTEYAVVMKWPNGRAAEVRVETADGATGHAVHAGRSYDLADGVVFALMPRDDGFEVRQFRRDLSAVSADTVGVTKFIRTDQDILKTFAAVK